MISRPACWPLDKRGHASRWVYPAGMLNITSAAIISSRVVSCVAARKHLRKRTRRLNLE